MPRFPDTTPTLDSVGGAVFSALAVRLARHQGPVYPLHVGDTWLEPAEGCRMQDLSVDEHPGMHRYASPQGLPDLIDAVAERSRKRMGVATEHSSVLIAAGATGALGAVIGSIVEPGDEVLVLAPYWPLITGIVRCFHGEPVAVPFDEVDSPESAIQAVQQRLSSKTVALYLSTPNNPSGRVFPASWVDALVDWAVSNELWVVSDEVYEDYVYRGEHCYARSRAPQQTFSVHSFSKAFGMAGNRCGYVVGPDSAMGSLNKVSTHAFYSTPTASQLAALRALDGRGDAWIDAIRPRYQALGEAAAERLDVPAPEGGTFLFVDTTDRLDDRGLLGFLEDCADEGLFLAPGPSFGAYPTHVRICFTCAEPEIVKAGVDVLARMLGRT
jgi:N-succinyldiaminopimelate aminotransferase